LKFIELCTTIYTYSITSLISGSKKWVYIMQ